MTAETKTPTSDGGSENEYGQDSQTKRSRLALPTDRNGVVVWAGVVAAAAVAATTGTRVLVNLPFDPVPTTELRQLAVGVLPVVLCGALVASAIATERATTRVGLLFAGVFGILPTFSDAAILPAVVGVAAGGGVALVGTLGLPSTYRSFRRIAVAVAFVGGIAVSLASSTGILPVGFRSSGSLLVVVGMTATGIRTEGDRIAVAAGVAAFFATVAAIVSNPYVVGSAMVAAFAVVGVPHLLVAAAVGSCVGVTVAGLRRREYTTATGGILLLLAGVPVTPMRAMAVLFGAMLVLLNVDTLTADVEGGEEVTLS